MRLIKIGAIAQLGERLHGMQEVVGSIPTSSTIPQPGVGSSLNTLTLQHDSHAQIAKTPTPRKPPSLSPRANVRHLGERFCNVGSTGQCVVLYIPAVLASHHARCKDEDPHFALWQGHYLFELMSISMALLRICFSNSFFSFAFLLPKFSSSARQKCPCRQTSFCRCKRWPSRRQTSVNCPPLMALAPFV